MKLKRVIGFFTSTMYGIGIILGAGVYALVARAHKFCRANGVAVAGKIPFDPLVTRAMVARKPVVEYSPKSRVSKAIAELRNQTFTRLNAS